MIQVKKINKKTYKAFYNQNLNLLTTFLQSLEWGNFQEKLGFPVIRLGVFKNQALKAIAQVIKIKAKRGNFLFIPHGPIIKDNDKNQIKLLIKKLTEYLINIAKAENFDFLRIAPILENTLAYKKIFQNLGYKTAPIYLHAETTWVLCLWIKPKKKFYPKCEKLPVILSEKHKNKELLLKNELIKKLLKISMIFILKLQKEKNLLLFPTTIFKRNLKLFKKLAPACFSLLK